ncbi:Putative arsenate reductase (ArsC) [Amycolatopsis japonica]|uniref:Putative arsenate reductase (ArsC) n=1 Tax=Amycolatopsis japonica TaxID=208439 RepID=A0A075V1N4_9PSEU|nr:low molecular weight phosphatase family protein [Amycolatopsis japonica]AIG80402.1 Putative arsenate reductase (ArsC) [Amycolatopsis japonica]
MTHATDGLPAGKVLDVLDRIADELGDRFQGTFGRDTVERFVTETYYLLERTATVKTHLSTLTARFARERLLDLAKADGLTQVTAPQVLFVCVHNVGRSQMAAALLAHHAFGHVMVRSAGSQPTGTIPPVITEALGEFDIELSNGFPKPLTDEVVRAADVVVTMGCGDACPVYPGKRYLDWDVPDPMNQPLSVVRTIRDEIDRRVRQLLEELQG